MAPPSLGRILPLEDWPERDRQLWETGLLPGDILEGEQYAKSIRPITLRSSAKSYGRWLAVLAEQDPASLMLDPVERVTPSRARLFLQALQNAGNTNNTIQTRFWQLRSALQVMYPRHDFQWLNKPGDNYLSMLLPAVLRPRRFIDARELARWGDELMRKGLKRGADPRIEWFRNGLLIAFLALRAPRQRSLASLRLGHSILRRGKEFQIAFRAEDMKGGRPLTYFLPEQLTPRIDHYLEVVRPRLLKGQTHDWFWVNRDGNRLAEIGIEGVISRAAMARFGFKIRAHSFRHSLATTGMLLDPSNPKKIAAVLGNSPHTVEQHYDLGGQIEASQQWQETLEEFLDDDDS